MTALRTAKALTAGVLLAAGAATAGIGVHLAQAHQSKVALGSSATTPGADTPADAAGTAISASPTVAATASAPTASPTTAATAAAAPTTAAAAPTTATVSSTTTEAQTTTNGS